MFQVTRPLRPIALCTEHPLNPIRPVLFGRESGEGVDLVVLKIFPGGRVYLAGLVDQRNRVVEWLEVWVQCSHELDTSPLSRVSVAANALYDKQWLNAIDAIRDFDDEHFIETKWEAAPTAPLVVDIDQMAVVRLVLPESGVPFELCRDDSVLKAAQLGAYSSTLERWFFAKTPNGEVTWASVHELLAGESPEKVAIPETGRNARTTDFNVGAGFMLLRKHHPVGIDAFGDWLDALARGDLAAQPKRDSSPIESDTLAAWTQMSQQLPGGDVVTENAYLRVQFWCAMVAEVHKLCTRLGVPFLNLTIDSFRVSLCTPVTQRAPMCPFRPVLVHPGDAIAIKVGDTEVGFAPLRGALSSPYALPKFGGWLDGSGTIRVRQVSDAGQGHSRIEGVIDSKELKNVMPGTYAWVQARVDGHSISFFAKVEADAGGARAGIPFSAAAAQLPPNADNRLKAIPRHPCQFVLLDPVHPVFDVYSLGVIGVRMFLTQDTQALNEVVDDILELAALLPQGATTDDLHQLSRAKEVNDRVRALLSVPYWAKDPAGEPRLAENVWYIIVRELVEFVAAEVPAEDTSGALDGRHWLQPLSERLASLQEVTGQIGRLLISPRPDHEEVARIVHSFV